MLSPLKPLLCRHDFYWSERHRADRCRRCGKTQAGESLEVMMPFDRPLGGLQAHGAATFTADGELASFPDSFFDLPSAEPRSLASRPVVRPSTKVLKAQARERRDSLLSLLDRLADGGQLSRQDALDAVLGVIEDAHSADPVLFGSDAVGQFARLHEARRG